MAEVFISYRREPPDQRLAFSLDQYLTAKGISCFIDSKLQVGQNWVDTIDREVRAARSFVVVLSERSISREMVRREVELAKKHQKQILPIWVDQPIELPYDLGAWLGKIHWQIWQSTQPVEPICALVHAAVLSHASAEPAPAASPARSLASVTEQRGIPLPSADPRLETGGLKVDSPFYIRRAADGIAEDLVRQSGETILIKGPRQVGKTSLAARARLAADRNTQQTCYVDFQLAGANRRFQDHGTLLKYLAFRLKRDAGLQRDPTEFWDDYLGDADSLTEYVEKALLPGLTKPFTLFLDEVDHVFGHPYRDSFFGMLRGWHNRRATHRAWEQFNLVIIHSTEPMLFIQNMDESPFNVGVRMELGDFSPDELRELNARHSKPLTAAELASLQSLVGGHPFLIRSALYNAHHNGLDSVLRDATAENGPFADHLHRQLWALRDNEPLRAALRKVLDGGLCDEERHFQRLRAAGLIIGDTRDAAKPRCELYRAYLRKHL